MSRLLATNLTTAALITEHYAVSPPGRPHGGLRAARCAAPTQPMPVFDVEAAIAALRAYRP